MLSRQRLDRAARCLLAGGIVAYPTEAVYGLGCLPFTLDAVARILALKGRSARKGLILIACSVEQLEPFVALADAPRRDEILASWPGPVTWVLPSRRDVPSLLTGGRNTLAVRVTAHPEARYLCERTGSALVSTSANRAGRRPARSTLEVRARLGRSVDVICGGRVGDLARPTTIRDAATGNVLRAG
jgi:L-threonylcarbamoyladenylate synthase